MPQVNIPESLFHEVEKALPNAVSADQFVIMAIQEKLTLEDRKRDFYRLSAITSAAMHEKGLTESDMLAAFESSRQTPSG